MTKQKDIKQPSDDKVQNYISHPACQILRPRDLCRILGCSKSAIRAWELSGILPPARRNGARFTYWLKADLDDYLKKTPHSKVECVQPEVNMC